MEPPTVPRPKRGMSTQTIIVSSNLAGGRATSATASSAQPLERSRSLNLSNRMRIEEENSLMESKDLPKEIGDVMETMTPSSVQFPRLERRDGDWVSAEESLRWQRWMSQAKGEAPSSRLLEEEHGGMTTSTDSHGNSLQVVRSYSMSEEEREASPGIVHLAAPLIEGKEERSSPPLDETSATASSFPKADEEWLHQQDREYENQQVREYDQQQDREYENQQDREYENLQVREYDQQQDREYEQQQDREYDQQQDEEQVTEQQEREADSVPEDNRYEAPPQQSNFHFDYENPLLEGEVGMETMNRYEADANSQPLADSFAQPPADYYEQDSQQAFPFPHPSIGSSALLEGEGDGSSLYPDESALVPEAENANGYAYAYDYNYSHYGGSAQGEYAEDYTADYTASYSSYSYYHEESSAAIVNEYLPHDDYYSQNNTSVAEELEQTMGSPHVHFSASVDGTSPAQVVNDPRQAVHRMTPRHLQVWGRFFENALQARRAQGEEEENTFEDDREDLTDSKTNAETSPRPKDVEVDLQSAFARKFFTVAMGPPSPAYDEAGVEEEIEVRAQRSRDRLCSGWFVLSSKNRYVSLRRLAHSLCASRNVILPPNTSSEEVLQCALYACFMVGDMVLCEEVLRHPIIQTRLSQLVDKQFHRSPLHYACKHDSFVNLMPLLYDCLEESYPELEEESTEPEGVNRRDINGHTALHVCVAMRQEKQLIFLLNCAADYDLKDREGLSSVDLARGLQERTLLSLFMDHQMGNLSSSISRQSWTSQSPIPSIPAAANQSDGTAVQESVGGLVSPTINPRASKEATAGDRFERDDDNDLMMKLKTQYGIDQPVELSKTGISNHLPSSQKADLRGNRPMLMEESKDLSEREEEEGDDQEDDDDDDGEQGSSLGVSWFSSLADGVAERFWGLGLFLIGLSLHFLLPKGSTSVPSQLVSADGSLQRQDRQRPPAKTVEEEEEEEEEDSKSLHSPPPSGPSLVPPSLSAPPPPPTDSQLQSQLQHVASAERPRFLSPPAAVAQDLERARNRYSLPSALPPGAAWRYVPYQPQS
eukprot:gene10170-11254_t